MRHCDQSRGQCPSVMEEMSSAYSLFIQTHIETSDGSVFETASVWHKSCQTRKISSSAYEHLLNSEELKLCSGASESLVVKPMF
ncbi:unnamed protein product [Protopolystoma xenopodis]|uniref:Uncharacterized protein n=1 Tax=Protopolystoma xenopodis TaxID=117903 RepID=A0A448XJP0_9PLAT|nr:unnamed protein product [Protopolystoma xenopodis]